MNSFISDGIEIAYLDEGEGEPILLIHGFASNLVANWIDPGLGAHTRRQAGRRVIAYDNGGHGTERANSTIRTCTARRRWRRTGGGCSIISASRGPM